MELKKFNVRRYKGYRKETSFELAPLTILIGENNSGKSSLSRAIHLFSKSLACPEDHSNEPLILSADGITHGRNFDDLVSGYSGHGELSLLSEFEHEKKNLTLSVVIQNVVDRSMKSQRQILKWRMTRENNTLEIKRESIEFQSNYNLVDNGEHKGSLKINWKGLFPRNYDHFPSWVEKNTQLLKKWAAGIRYLKCPRSFPTSHFNAETFPSSFQEAEGVSTPILLIKDEVLRASVRNWYLKTFNVNLDISSEGRYSDLTISSPLNKDINILLDQSGTGLAQVLPVAVRSITAKHVGQGVDIIEHPESELHPATHTLIADLLINNLSGSSRPLIIETHSELILLRVRRRIAEGRLNPDHVIVYWVQTEPKIGASLQKINIDELGEMSSWPDGVFFEPYEEVISIRQAVHQKKR